MSEELGCEVTPKQSLDGLWRTMHKYIEHHGYSDISLELEGSQYEFRQHLQKYDEYEAKAKAFDVIKEYITDELRDMRRVTEDVPFAFAEELEALEDVLDKMTEYESGEPEIK